MTRNVMFLLPEKHGNVTTTLGIFSTTIPNETDRKTPKWDHKTDTKETLSPMRARHSLSTVSSSNTNSPFENTS